MKRETYNLLVGDSITVQKIWKTTPAPKRGELIRLFGNNLRKNLISLSSSLGS